jgi:hypothetical protein
MRSALTVLITLWASVAAAHPGHLIEQAGHNHWLAGAAIGAAVLIGLREAAKRRREAAELSEPEEEISGEEEAA